jgi:hypothetical protein
MTLQLARLHFSTTICWTLFTKELVLKLTVFSLISPYAEEIGIFQVAKRRNPSIQESLVVETDRYPLVKDYSIKIYEPNHFTLHDLH